jgi:hypothetical protein
VHDEIKKHLPNIFQTSNPVLGEKLRDDWATSIMSSPPMTAIWAWLRQDYLASCCDECFTAWADEVGIPHAVREWVSVGDRS